MPIKAYYGNSDNARFVPSTFDCATDILSGSSSDLRARFSTVLDLGLCSVTGSETDCSLFWSAVRCRLLPYLHEMVPVQDRLLRERTFPSGAFCQNNAVCCDGSDIGVGVNKGLAVASQSLLELAVLCLFWAVTLSVGGASKVFFGRVLAASRFVPFLILLLLSCLYSWKNVFSLSKWL